MVALRLRWVRRFSTLVGCANAMVPRSALQACVFVREVVSRSGRSGPDSSACRTDFISTFCTQCPLAFGGFPLPLRSKLNSCRMQKPNRGKNQVKESSLVTYGFRKALVLPFTFFLKTSVAYCMLKQLEYIFRASVCRKDLTGCLRPESPLACPRSLLSVMPAAPAHGMLGTCCWDELAMKMPTLVPPFAHPAAFLGARSFSIIGIKVYPRKLAGLARQKVPFL